MQNFLYCEFFPENEFLRWADGHLDMPGLLEKISSFARGEWRNTSEDRWVRHTALRAGECTSSSSVNEAVSAATVVRSAMRDFVQRFTDGEVSGATGQALRNVVNIGIGGSDLGPRMAVQALSAFCQPGVAVRFVANLDGADLEEALFGLDPAETLFVVASKTFTTAESLQNARSALDWLCDSLKLSRDQALASHFVGVTADPVAAEGFGISPERVFRFWDWVGGRFSLWSAIGLPIALAIGFEQFEFLLAGAQAMDEHLVCAPLHDNLPVRLALFDTWNISVRGAVGLSVVPYAHRLRSLPAYLQQLEMESNGKRVALSGGLVNHDTAPIVFGDAGTNAQHSYFQMLHQGTREIISHLILVGQDQSRFSGHHSSLLANALAQRLALAEGGHSDELYRQCPGGRSSVTILVPALNPYFLGQLLALYEHKVLVQGMLWNINSFDQWGVELGKTIARRIHPVIERGQDLSGLDCGTVRLIDRIWAFRA